MADWSFLTTHARVLVCIAHDPGARLRDIAATLGITERRAHGIITDLAEAGYVVKQKDGRRNRYQVQAHLPLAEPGTREPAVGEVLAVLLGNTDGFAGPRAARMSSSLRAGGPAAGRMTTGPARTGPGTILFPATMVAPGLLARCDGIDEAPRSLRPCGRAARPGPGGAGVLHARAAPAAIGPGAGQHVAVLPGASGFLRGDRSE